MQCRICGDYNNVSYHYAKHQALCPTCDKETPVKVSRSEFDRIYWGERKDEVPLSTSREFYEDYISSTCTIDEYILATTSRSED